MTQNAPLQTQNFSYKSSNFVRKWFMMYSIFCILWLNFVILNLDFDEISSEFRQDFQKMSKFIENLIKLKHFFPKSPKRCAWNVACLVILRSAFSTGPCFWSRKSSTGSSDNVSSLKEDRPHSAHSLLFNWQMIDVERVSSLIFIWASIEKQLIFDWFSIIFAGFSIEFQLNVHLILN